MLQVLGMGMSVNAPWKCDITKDDVAIFLAGGTTGPNWQIEVIERILLQMEGCFPRPLLLNPRRTDFTSEDPAAVLEQTRWELEHIQKADAVFFWFPSTSLCPISFFELGMCAMGNKPIFLGVDHRYQKKSDLEMRIAISRPDIVLRSSISETINDCVLYINSRQAGYERNNLR